MDDMEVVGTGTNHNPDGDASVEVYRPKAGATTDAYTFHPAQTVEASGEPGGTATGPATWTRWTAGFAPPAPAATGATSGTALTEDSFRVLMTIKDVETRLTAKVSLKAEFRDYKDMAGRADTSQVGNMDSWYGLTIEAADGGPRMTFSVIDFDSTSSAQNHLEKTISETPGMQVMIPS